MNRTRKCFNHAAPAAAGRAARPAVPGPDGAETWYRITNTMDADTGTAVASVHIYGDIGSWGISAASFVDELKAVDAPEIQLYINSPGGEVFDGLAIHNALRSHRARVIVQVDSLAASIASVIAMAGDRIVMSPHSQMMIHDASGVSMGDAAELREYADFLDRQSDNIAAVYAERAGGTAGQWRKRMKAETWYFADEAVEAGLADEVAKPMRRSDEDEDMPGMDRALAASWDLTVYNYAHSGRDKAPAPDIVAPVSKASGVHHTATVDTTWDGPGQVAKAPNEAATLRYMHAWRDPDGDPNAKSSYKFPHHAAGTDTAANMAAVRNGLARLSQADIPAADRAGVEAHLRAHLADGGGGEEDHLDDEPGFVFDPDAFRAATVAALDPMPDYDPGHLRSLMASVAGDAPAVPPPQRPAPVADTGPAPAAVPEPPAPANEVAVGYFRQLMAIAATDLAAPDRPAAPDPGPPEPVPAIDIKAFERSLREARL